MSATRAGWAGPSLRAAVIRNSPQVLANFGAVSGSAVIDGVLGLVGFVVCVAIGITIAESPTRQGFHDRLAGGTFVVRPAAHVPPPLSPPSAPPT